MMQKKGLFSELWKFVIIGTVCAVLYMFLTYVFTEYAGIYYVYSAAIAFVFSMTLSFIFNKSWTFDVKSNSKLKKMYLRYFIVALLAMAVNLFVLYLVTELFLVHYLISQAIAILVSLWVNFFGNKFWTFEK
jgi:dolichol-phosphate mannosyltransferase